MNKLNYKLFAFTLFTSAFLLFLIQPLFSKMLLPVYGANASIWSVAICFFQICLLGGYLFSYLIIKFLTKKIQAITFISLIIISIFFSSPYIDEVINYTDNQYLNILIIMLLNIGLPFIALSATTPLIQHWFSQVFNEENPYRLFASSNAGSLIALIVFPLFFEPVFGLTELSNLWSYGLFVFLALTILISFNLFKDKKSPEIVHEEIKVKKSNILFWIMLAFIPAALLPSLTAHLTTDITPTPMIWVIPLCLYLLSFVKAFKVKEGFISLKLAYFIQAVFVCLIISTYIAGYNQYATLMFTLHIGLFYFTCFACHRQLYILRPAASKLSLYYIYIALGGALGGIFIAIFAPMIFPLPIEYTLVLILSFFTRYLSDSYHSISNCMARTKEYIKTKKFQISGYLFAFITCIGFSILALELTGRQMILFSSIFTCMGLIYIFDQRFKFAIAVSFIFLIHPTFIWERFTNPVHTERNFYGSVRVLEAEFKELQYRAIYHGTTNHGSQIVNNEFEHIPLTYYSKKSGIGEVMQLLDTNTSQEQNIAVIGLGIGSIAAYQKEGRNFDFFEINPAIIKIARNKDFFTFISNCEKSCNIIEGDGRIEISKKDNNKYDLIVVDAFSSDSIPVHLITKEAVSIYMDKLKQDGYLVMHISNSYIDLTNELYNIARKLGLSSGAIVYKAGGLIDSEKGITYSASSYIIISNQLSSIENLHQYSDKLTIDEFKGLDFKPWTDDKNYIPRAFRIWINSFE